jgi:protein-disulfide isomerase
MDKRFLGILAAIVIIFIGIFAINQNSSSNSASGSNGSSSSGPTNHVQGDNAKNVTFLEYGDYECPFCENYYLPVKDAVAQLSKDIKFQFRNLPLVSLHQNAFAGARAAEAAGLQNKFWEMHDLLYQNQKQWVSASSPQDSFNQYAQQLALNVEQFKKDYISSKVNDMINADVAEFEKTGQDKSTPSFFLNGKPVPLSSLSDPQTGAANTEMIVKTIQEEIAKTNK